MICVCIAVGGDDPEPVVTYAKSAIQINVSSPSVKAYEAKPFTIENADSDVSDASAFSHKRSM